MEPWKTDPGKYGRLRLTEEVALEVEIALELYKKQQWEIVTRSEDPSEQGSQALRAIRNTQKASKWLRGLIEEKGWGGET